MSISKKLRQLREDREKTQREVANAFDEILEIK